MRFSPSTSGWYPESIHYPNLPDDLVTVSEATYQSLQGKRVVPDAHGQPVAWTAPVVVMTPAEKRMALKAAATAKRWEAETQGITMPSGAVIGTTIDDQNRISNATAHAIRMGLQSVRFKDAENNFQSIPVADLTAIADAVALHVQACFDAEAAHFEAIDALSGDQLDAYDITTGWPS